MMKKQQQNKIVINFDGQTYVCQAFTLSFLVCLSSSSMFSALRSHHPNVGRLRESWHLTHTISYFKFSPQSYSSHPNNVFMAGLAGRAVWQVKHWGEFSTTVGLRFPPLKSNMLLINGLGFGERYLEKSRRLGKLERKKERKSLQWKDALSLSLSSGWKERKKKTSWDSRINEETGTHIYTHNRKSELLGVFFFTQFYWESIVKWHRFGVSAQMACGWISKAKCLLKIQLKYRS